jgi:deoxyribodipyrimidine photolyase-like uncharacterized protein
MLDYIFGKNDLVQKLETMNKSNLDKVDGFIKGLISQREFVQKFPEKRKPLLAKKEQDE